MGWAISPMIGAAIMDSRADAAAGLALGFWVTLWWSGFALVFFIAAFVLYQKEVQKMGVVTAADELSFEEVSTEAARRRIVAGY